MNEDLFKLILLLCGASSSATFCTVLHLQNHTKEQTKTDSLLKSMFNGANIFEDSHPRQVVNYYTIQYQQQKSEKLGITVCKYIKIHDK